MLDLKNISIVFNEGTVDEKKALNDINLSMEKRRFRNCNR